jgi:hypothetical protein
VGGFGEEENLFPLPEFELRIVLPVASRYTDYAIPKVRKGMNIRWTGHVAHMGEMVVLVTVRA